MYGCIPSPVSIRIRFWPVPIRYVFVPGISMVVQRVPRTLEGEFAGVLAQNSDYIGRYLIVSILLRGGGLTFSISGIETSCSVILECPKFPNEVEARKLCRRAILQFKYLSKYLLALADNLPNRQTVLQTHQT